MKPRASWIMGCSLVFMQHAAWAQEVALPPAELPPSPPAVELPEVQVPTTPTVEAEPATQQNPSDETSVNPAEVQNNAESAQTTPESPPQQPPAQETSANPAAAQNDEATVQTTPENTPVEEQEQSFVASYGTYETSILFSADEIDRMKKVLYISESFRGKEEAAIPETEEDEYKDLLGDLQQQTGQQPKPIDSYPAFHIASIMYKSPRDWAFWLNGERVTPKKLPAGIEIINVSSLAVRFHWKPENASEFRSHWKAIEAGEASQAPKTVVSKTNDVSLTEDKDAWQFTVRPNQTFATQFMAVLEGRHVGTTAGEGGAISQGAISNSPMESGTANAPLGNRDQGAVGATAAPAGSDSNLRGTMNELLERNRALSGLSPKNSGGSGLVSDVPAPTPPAPPAAAPDAAAAALQGLLGGLQQAVGASGGTTTPPEGLPVLPNQ